MVSFVFALGQTILQVFLWSSKSLFKRELFTTRRQLHTIYAFSKTKLNNMDRKHIYREVLYSSSSYYYYIFYPLFISNLCFNSRNTSSAILLNIISMNTFTLNLRYNIHICFYNTSVKTYDVLLLHLRHALDFFQLYST